MAGGQVIEPAWIGATCGAALHRQIQKVAAGNISENRSRGCKKRRSGTESWLDLLRE
jgi:hypothetical protein